MAAEWAESGMRKKEKVQPLCWETLLCMLLTWWKNVRIVSTTKWMPQWLKPPQSKTTTTAVKKNNNNLRTVTLIRKGIISWGIIGSTFLTHYYTLQILHLGQIYIASLHILSPPIHLLSHFIILWLDKTYTHTCEHIYTLQVHCYATFLHNLNV